QPITEGYDGMPLREIQRNFHLAKWHAAQWRGVISRRAGRSWRHRSSAIGQRGWNGQPLGGAKGEGTSPASTRRGRLETGSITGTAERRACVYGCLGARQSVLASADSTILPRYITRTRRLMCSITAKSCAMKR